MNKDILRGRILGSMHLSSSDRLVALVIIQHTDKQGERCYRTMEFISSQTKLCENTVRASIKNLVDSGFLRQESASQRPDIPKRRGYVWSVIQGGDDAIAPSQDEPSQDEPSMVEGSDSDAKPSRSQVKENSHLQSPCGLNPQPLRVSTTVHYSDTLQGGDRGTSSPPSRACADAREGRTYSDPTSSSSPTKNSESYQQHEAEAPATKKVVERAEVAAIRQALEEALPTVDLSGVRGLYGIAQTILEDRGELEAARRYVEARGLEWTQRLLEGQRYSPHAIARLIARDAATWRGVAPSQAPVTHAAQRQAAPPSELPPWWDTLLKQVYEALKAHRHNDTDLSRTYAKQLSCLLHHLTRPQRVQLDAGLLTITIDDSGPDPDSFSAATSYIPTLLKRALDLDLDDVRFLRAHHALSLAC